MKGGKSLSFAEGAEGGSGAVLGGWGRWRSMKRMLVGVRKEEMWVEANWSVRFRYLHRGYWYQLRQSMLPKLVV